MTIRRKLTGLYRARFGDWGVLKGQFASGREGRDEREGGGGLLWGLIDEVKHGGYFLLQRNLGKKRGFLKNPNHPYWG